MTIAKVWVGKRQFDGEPSVDDFLLKEETLPELKDGEILIEALYLSLDPYIRLFPADESLPGEQIARIIESKAEGFPVGALVAAHAGWRTRTVVNVHEPLRFGIKVELIEQVPGLSPSLWIGAIGMPGVTAYLSFTEKCNPKKGEVIVISAASGAVGSIVGQLAKLQGLTVVGLVGSKSKTDFIKELGFDHAINYKTEDVASRLHDIAPDGVDIFYDNVGGKVRDIVIDQLKETGRVLFCGQIAAYNHPEPQAKNWYMTIVRKELDLRGFYIFGPQNVGKFPRARKALIPLFQQGKLKAKEHITDGFDQMPKAFIELFSGSNLGKAVVKV